jgi:hypothetical protein
MASNLPLDYAIAVNWHQLIDERNYEMDRVIAAILEKDPSKVDLVVSWIEKRLADPEFSIHSKDGLREWLDLIRNHGLRGVLDLLADRGEEAMRLRQSSPFAILMPQDERSRILRRYEALRPRAHPSGV